MCIVGKGVTFFFMWYLRAKKIINKKIETKLLRSTYLSSSEIVVL